MPGKVIRFGVKISSEIPDAMTGNTFNSTRLPANGIAQQLHAIAASPVAHYAPGQHVIVRLNVSGQTQDIQRSYTLSGAPGQDHYRITVKREGLPFQSFRWLDGYGNLLNLLEKHDIYPPSSCREGSCMSCSTRMLSRAVSYVPEPFGDPFDGEILLCCARPLTDIELEL